MKISQNPNTDSPKTPGGISKSLLTPCRRVGLSRKWRKSTVSPFNSPVTSNNEESPCTTDKGEGRKRKELCDQPLTPSSANCEVKNDVKVDSTPTRVELPRKKRSKTLLSSITNNENSSQLDTSCVDENKTNFDKNNAEKKTNKNDFENNLNKNNAENNINKKNLESVIENDLESKDCEQITEVATPVRLKSKSKSKRKSPKSAINKTSDIEKKDSKEEVKEKSPNNLTKECIVVIQKKIFKKDIHKENSLQKTKEKSKKTSPTIDSDSDDVPLCNINKLDAKNDTIPNTETKKLANLVKISSTETKSLVKIPSTESKSLTKQVDDDDFTSTPKVKPKKESKPTVEPTIDKTKKIQKTNSKPQINTQFRPSQISDDDDDDFIEKKKTILIKKTYNKVVKPIKAKSTGSITQKDIDDLKNRIETKKKMLLAKAMTEDTKEVRDLIKKWQKGCQDALMELMDIMKSKLPEKNMEYSELLKTLKIPSSLVGYDSDNDCFVTPEDKDIILADLD